MAVISDVEKLLIDIVRQVRGVAVALSGVRLENGSDHRFRFPRGPLTDRLRRAYGDV